MKKRHIFIQCASYRDPELKNTISTAINNAKIPNKVSFGICWQGKPESDLEQLNYKKFNHCRVVLIDSDKTEGIGYARAKAMHMFEDEEYTLQIDSHMKFLPNWDETMIKLLSSCPSNKPLITAYLSDYILKEEPGCYRLGASKFSNDKNLLISGMSIVEDKIQPGMLTSAHFIFAKSQFWEEVPIDPNLAFLYEELTQAPRAFTHGWDIFYPHVAPMQHRWGRGYRRCNWDDKDWSLADTISGKLYRQLMNIEPGFHNFEKYGLGQKRTLEDYEKFAGINFRKQTIHEAALEGYPVTYWKNHIKN
jgi:Glycosyltransferase (GlcNAc)